MLRPEERSIEVDAQNPSPFIKSRFGDGFGEGHTGVVDKNVDPLVSGQDTLDHRHPSRLLGDIQFHRLSFAGLITDHVGNLLCCVSINVRDDDRRPFIGEQDGCGSADA